MNKVVIYSTPTCHFCHVAKDFFKEHKVEFVEFDVSSDLIKRNEMIEKSGQRGVPVMIIKDEIVVGFNESEMIDLLGITI